MSIRNLNVGQQYSQYTPELVDYWDQLVDWESRIASEGSFFERLLGGSGIRKVADVASGTGFNAINLAQSGFEVTATDHSEHMVEKTRENAERMGVNLAGISVADWIRLDEELGENSFDAVVCLGNSFAHLFEHEARRDAMEAFHRVVRPGGMLLIDHRNYDAMLEPGYTSEHPPHHTGEEVEAYPAELNRYMARFEYKFPDGARFQLQMYPLRQDYVSHLLEDAGFINVDRFGDFQKPYDRLGADFIQQVAFKPTE